MSINNTKKNLFLFVWSKYMPVIRILLKRSATGVQTLNMNRTDFERDGKARKAGYKFVVNFVKGKPELISAGNELIQSLTYSLTNDEVVYEHLLKNDYTFTFNSKYKLEIRNNSLSSKTTEEVSMEEEVPEMSV